MSRIEKVIFGDCLEEMENIPDNSVDMILTDLPYELISAKWDILIPLDKLWNQYNRIVKNDAAILLFGTQPFTTKLISSNLKMFKYEIIWHKSKASNFVHSKYQPLKTHENIIVFSKKPAAQNSKKDNNMKYYPQMTNGEPYDKGFSHPGKLNSFLSKGSNGARLKSDGNRYPRSVVYFRTAESEGRFHVSQKPIALLEYLIKTYTNENDLVLDNTCGSGSTLVAAKNLNRQFIGIEKEQKYYEITLSRLYP